MEEGNPEVTNPAPTATIFQRGDIVMFKRPAVDLICVVRFHKPETHELIVDLLDAPRWDYDTLFVPIERATKLASSQIATLPSALVEAIQKQREIYKPVVKQRQSGIDIDDLSPDVLARIKEILQEEIETKTERDL